MPKYRLHAIVTGGKYIGVVEAPNKEAAKEMGELHENAYISLCHHCADECEDPQVVEILAEEVNEE